MIDTESSDGHVFKISPFLFLLKGVLDSAGFPAVVTAHFVPMEGQQRPRTTILIKFAEEVNTPVL